MTRWYRRYWDEEDLMFFFEADDNGWVLRQVELRGANRTPTVAAALEEWPDADRDGLAAVQAYEAKYGGLADQPSTEWGDAIEIAGEEFEAVWQKARAHLDRPR